MYKKLKKHITWAIIVSLLAVNICSASFASSIDDIIPSSHDKLSAVSSNETSEILQKLMKKEEWLLAGNKLMDFGITL